MRDTFRTGVIAALCGFVGALLAGGAAVAGGMLALPQANGTTLWVGGSTISANQFLQVDSTGKHVVGNAGGGSGAPTTAQYVTMTTDAGLSAERTLAGEAGVVSVTDGGANNPVTVGLSSNGVTNAKLRDSGPLSVIGRAANSSGDPADISATAATDTVLRESASTIGFGTLATGALNNDAVTFAKLQNLNTDRLLGRDTAASGDAEEITVGGGLEFTGSGGLQRSALTGDVTASAGSSSTTIANDAVTYAKMQDVSATSRLLGRITAGAGDTEELTGTQATTLLDAFTSALKGLAPASGGGTTNFLRADGTWAAPAGGASPAWHGDIYGAYGDCSPADLMDSVQSKGVVSPTPTNIGTSVARCCFFRPPADITVDKIRFYGVGATSGIYRVAIYRYSDLARLAVVNDFNTSANTWGAAGSNLNLSLTGGTLYFIAVAVDSTGTTAGVLSMGPSIAATTGQVQTAPGSLPGNLDADAGFLSGYTFQFAVTSGALPDPAATLAAQGAWSGGMPAFWLDASDL